MNEILVIGHKNPDTDSICSAYCYAALKNRLDPKEAYEAGRCGNLNRQTKFVFDTFAVPPPRFFGDIYPRVSDIMTRNVVAMDMNEPVYRAMKNIDELKIRINPVVESGIFKGVVSIIEVTDFLISDNVSRNPEILLRPGNFPKVLRGRFFREGERDEFPGIFVIGAMPFEKSVRHMLSLDFEKTVLIVGMRRDIIEFAVEKRLPAIVITGVEAHEKLDIDLGGYNGWVYLSEMDTAWTYRRLMLSTPARAIMNSSLPGVAETDYVDAARDVLLKLDHRGLPVLREGKLVGIITRSDLIKRFQKRIILMDHNELTQAVDGAESAEIREIVDHHRLGTVKTRLPISVYARPVGSTCTLVYQLYKTNGVPMEPAVAGLLLSGILSDTTILRSPTTTPDDTEAVQDLARISGLDPEAYGIEMFSATESITTRDPKNVIEADFKVYREFGVSVGIGQVEVVNAESVFSVKEQFVASMREVCASKGINWAMLLITDIVKQDSLLVVTDLPRAERLMSYKKVGDNIYELTGVLSRKKQLLPEILRVLEEMAQKPANGR